MLEAIAAARKQRSTSRSTRSRPTAGERQFIDALVDAAARGVKVQVIIDGWGSLLGGRSVKARLNAAGCDCRIYNRVLSILVLRLRRDHRKILLVDDAIAFLGGINIGDEYADDDKRPGWADLALQIRGPAAVRLGRRLRREKVGDWAGGVRIYLSSETGGRKLRKRYLKAFAVAKRADPGRARLLSCPTPASSARSVAPPSAACVVKLLLAGSSDVPFVRAATISLHRRLIGGGRADLRVDDVGAARQGGDDRSASAFSSAASTSIR